MYQALYRKYRSKTFDDVVGQNHITQTLKSQVASGKLSHAYLFTGTRGTGKTSCAKILARAVNCENPRDGNPCNACHSCLGIESGAILDVLEIDAASNNGVDNVRSLREEAVYGPASVNKRVYIIDEVHMLSGAAFNALLKIMEEPPEHLIFILATTELNKVPATILSRCQRFSFRRIEQGVIEKRLEFVARNEGIEFEQQAISLLARMGDGALRDAISLLDQCSSDGKVLTVENIYDSLGLAGNIKTAELMRAVSLGEIRAALDIFSDMYKAGKDIAALLSELTVLGRDLLITIMSNKGLISPVGGYDDETLNSIAANFTVESLVDIISELQATLANISKSANQRIEAEMCIIRICDVSMSGDSSALAARVSKLERLADTEVRAVPVQEKPDIPNIPVEAVPEDVPDKSEPPEIPDNTEALQPENTKTAAVPEQSTAVLEKNAAVLEKNAAVLGKNAALDSECASWQEIVSELRADVSIMEYVYLSNPELVGAFYRHGQLTLAVENDFILSMVNNDSVIAAVKSSAKSCLGTDVSVRIVLASTLKIPEKDNFAALLERAGEYDNITIKGD